MKRWTILTSIIIVGIAVAVGVWLFVRATTDTPNTDTTNTGEQRGFFSFFGDTFGINDNSASSTATTTPQENPVGPSFRERLRRAQMLPIGNSMLAGTTFTSVVTTSSTTDATSTEEFVRFIERETGHINDLSLETGKERRATNTTIPGIQEALWGNNGSTVALRYLSDDNETIETYLAPLETSTSTEPYELAGVFFPQNITSISLSPSKPEVFFITTASDRASGKVSDSTLKTQKAILSSTLHDWTSSWQTTDEIFITSKPSVSAVGVSYALKKDGSMTRIMTGNGLMVLPNPSGTRVLYTIASSNLLRSFVLTRSSQETLALSVRTLPEKCIWKNDDVLVCAVPNIVPNNALDAWYQGRLSFNDSLWTIDVANKRYDFLYAPEDTEARQTMDITNLALSSDGTLLSLINKKDLRGWIADLNATTDEE